MQYAACSNSYDNKAGWMRGRFLPSLIFLPYEFVYSFATLTNSVPQFVERLRPQFSDKLRWKCREQQQ